MIASMTGFGRSVLEASFGKIIIEIQSVNRKYFEVFISMPKEYGRFESEIRKLINESVSRGQVSVRIHVIPNSDNLARALPDFEMMRQLKEGWEEIAHRLGYDKKSVDLTFLSKNLPAQAPRDEVQDDDLEPFKKGTQEALAALVLMKRREGQALAHDMDQRLRLMEKILSQIESLSPDAVLRMKKKLQERIAEASPALIEGDDRIIREIAIFAEKVDITEEITRFRSHLVQFHDLLKEKSAIGRKMDFMVQEMGREINTIGSKSMESKIAHLVVEVKSELEKVREQIQNIE